MLCAYSAGGGLNPTPVFALLCQIFDVAVKRVLFG